MAWPQVQEAAQLVRAFEASCRIDCPSEQEKQFRLALMVKLGLAFKLGGLRKRYIFGGLALLGAAGPVVWHFMHDYQRRRVLTLLQAQISPVARNAATRLISTYLVNERRRKLQQEGVKALRDKAEVGYQERRAVDPFERFTRGDVARTREPGSSAGLGLLEFSTVLEAEKQKH